LIKKQVFDQPKDTLKVCLPAMLYILQNNLFYVAASHLDAATFMVSSDALILMNSRLDRLSTKNLRNSYLLNSSA
jgi:hypothetical protein